MQFKKGAELIIWSLVAEEERAVTSGAFNAYGRPLDMVTSFKYLGQVISAVDDDFLVLVTNMDKVWAVWQRLMSIISREGAAPRGSEFFFKAVVQSVLLFGAETWVFTPRMGWVLAGFQEHVA